LVRYEKEVHTASGDALSAVRNLDGICEGDVTIAELLTHGDFGLGTFNRLDGEMVVLDGICHHLRSDGSAQVAAPTDRTPFAAVTWFKPETTIGVPRPASPSDLHLSLPRTEAFLKANMAMSNIAQQIHQTEG
jgi:alpha-acetolactate decarboxylase